MKFIEFQDKLPPIIARKNVGKILGGAISPKTLANLSSLGKGPREIFHIGRTVAYETIELLTWLDER